MDLQKSTTVKYFQVQINIVIEASVPISWASTIFVSYIRLNFFNNQTKVPYILQLKNN